MAEKRGKAGRAQRFNDVEFINYELDKSEKAALKKWFTEGQDWLDMLDKLVEEGYRVSFKYDTFSESPACFIQHTEEDHDNAGRVLTGRGRHGSSAMIEALFKHYFCFKGVWPQRHDKQKFETWDD